MSGWPEREEGWEDLLIERARALFVETAERHFLSIEWDDTAPVEVACSYPAQPGLDFLIWMTLAGDEMAIGGDGWNAYLFPADLPSKWEGIRATLDGLITGEARVLLYTPVGRRKPYWNVIQLREAGRWRNVSTGVGCAIPPIIRPTILRNGLGRRVGGVRPAWGGLAVFGALAAFLVYLW